MMDDSNIKAEWFYESDSEKTKLNWFLYEVALEYQSFILSSKSLAVFRKRHSGENIAQFCTYYAKRMKKSVLDQLMGRTDVTIIDEDYIADFYPEISRRQSTLLLETACAAWDSHLSVCEICPTRCISEKEQMCEFFDDNGRY